MSNNNPYTLHTTLKPNRIYSCFGIKLKVKGQVDTFSNSGNFSIHINNINLQKLESANKGITKDTPIFCYVQDSKQTHIAKLQDKTTTMKIQLDTNLPKDSNGNLIPIIPKLIFLSFVPFRDSKEANNSPSQKIALTSDDINKGYYNVDFMILLRCFGEWVKTHNPKIKSNKSANEKEHYIDDEGYLHWEVDGVDRIKRPKDIWKKANYADKTKQLKAKLKQGNLIKEQVKAIVLHRTDSATAMQAINSFLGNGIGTHFLIDKDGTIYQCASLYKWTRHIGDIKAKDLEINGKDSADYSKYKNKTYSQVSKIEQTGKQYPNRYPINKDSIGIEVVGKCYNDKEEKIKVSLNYTQYNGKWEKSTQQQKDSTKQLADILKDIYNMTNDDIYGHGEISAHRTFNEGDNLYEK